MSCANEKCRPRDQLGRYFQSLVRAYGPQRWWPARTRLEVILGAILTQNTSWNNAALALRRLRKAGLLKWAELRAAPLPQLEMAVRSAGFYRQKARVIRNFVEWLERAQGGSLPRMFSQPLEVLRRQLLNLKGVGPETADAILLYAGGRPVFVADAYTRRILSRHGLLQPDSRYDQAREFLHQSLPADAALFNEFHALLVEAGKRHCRRDAPLCHGCPLEEFLPSAGDFPSARVPATLRAEARTLARASA